MKPQIGISSYEVQKERGAYLTLNNFYADAVIQAGGMPVIIPTIRTLEDAKLYAKTLDGLILTGGNENISPLYYEADMNKEIDYINPPRDEWEIALIKAFEANDKPILGICRGMQLINVSRGGSLHANVHKRDDSIGHFAGKTDMRYPIHQVEVEPSSILFSIFSESIAVNSYHYQGIDRLGQDLSIGASARDGLVEAIEDPNKNFVVGVQWHPEAMVTDSERMKSLFKLMISKSFK